MAQNRVRPGRDAYFIEGAATPIYGDVAGAQTFDKHLTLYKGIIASNDFVSVRAAGTWIASSGPGTLLLSLLLGNSGGSKILFSHIINQVANTGPSPWYFSGDIYVPNGDPVEGVLDAYFIFTVSLTGDYSIVTPAEAAAFPLPVATVPSFTHESGILFGEDQTLKFIAEYEDGDDVTQVVTLDAMRYIIQ